MTHLLPSLSVVLPCYDEAPNVAAAVYDARIAAGASALRHEVIVVDDGSTDQTATIAAMLAATFPEVRLVRHDRNRGYGAAVRTGIDASTGDWVLLTDGDRQFDLNELPRLVAAGARAGGADLVVGYRIARADPAFRRLSAAAWNRLMRASFGVGVRDVDCAFKLVRGDAVRELPLESDGAMISTELLVRARLASWRLAEVGVTHRPRTAGSPTGGDPRVILRAFGERRALRRRLREQAARDASPAGTPAARAALS
ncbi:MAG TPA: glycosyltransferase family 2 protein [Baekduia sp.]|uniref:glycosyltransferase family 2 protein n=1 Tax=Baekduia sp. TaxID=2600305 RepID=UPI002D766DC2|nr:glycosyltransferase family 2 protein [Baekduia sp.]HET6507470.1 glycosyltransferase family 2 protein [Baekduia sp.]